LQWALFKNFGLKQGALASSVAHDSHNIVAVGVDVEAFVRQLISLSPARAECLV
jgi:adenine deaminase